MAKILHKGDSVIRTEGCHRETLATVLNPNIFFQLKKRTISGFIKVKFNDSLLTYIYPREAFIKA